MLDLYSAADLRKINNIMHVILSSGLLLAVPAPALAYTGPTLGLGIVGTVVAILAVLLLSLFSFVYVPLRRMLKRKRGKHTDSESEHRN